MPPTSPASADPDAIAAFWDAVAATSESFVADMLALGGHTETEEFAHVARLLFRVHPDLLLVLGSQSASRPEIVISAGGIRELFPLVRQVTDAAPARATARYDVRAFRPRVGDPSGLRVRVKGQDIGPAEIRWTAKQQRRDRSRCDLTVYLPGWIDAFPADSTANRSTAEAVFLLLDHLVGEWAVVAQIGIIDWASTKKAPADALPLDALPNYLDTISAH